MNRNAASLRPHPRDPVSVLLAGLLYMPTLWFVPHAVYLLTLPVFLVRPLQFRSRDLLLGVFVVLAYANMAVHGGKFGSYADLTSATIGLMFAAVLIGRILDDRAARWLIYLVALECLIVAFEFVQGEPTLFAGQASVNFEAAAGEKGLLYNLRPFGLSANSSIIAQKILLALLLLHTFEDRFPFRTASFGVLLSGLVLTFNRTSILTYLIFLALLVASRQERRWLVTVAGVTVAGAAVLFVEPLLEAIVRQFIRGAENVTLEVLLARRTEIWPRTWEFITRNPLLGNGSLSFRLDLGSRTAHAHNSFLQMLATHGVLGLLPIAYLFLSIRRRTVIFALPLLLYSQFQYGVFWNISLMDIVLYHFLGPSLRGPGEDVTDATP